METITASKVQERITNFVTWIAPTPEYRKEIKEQREDIRKRIKNEAEEDGLIIISTPDAGSFAKKTGLRRHYRGESYIKGQDVDVPYVVKRDNDDEYVFDTLLSRFDKYAAAAYPKTERVLTKSSVNLKFERSREYDIVPLLSTNDLNIQILHRSFEDIKTSVQRHVEFIRSRSRISREIEGRVQFNECIRLFKWWGCFQYEKNYKNLNVPSIIIDMLCAKAFDMTSVSDNYIHTIARWSACLAHLLRNKTVIYFEDYVPKPKLEQNAWGIFDPVNNENNLAGKWTSYEIDTLASWFEETRDVCNRIIRADIDGDDNESLDYLVGLFGNPFKNHS
jgi:hypothetical protein